MDLLVDLELAKWDEELGQTQGLSFPAPLCIQPWPLLFALLSTPTFSAGDPEWLGSLLGSLRLSRQWFLPWAGGSILTLGPEGWFLGRGQPARECVDGGPTLFLEMGL